MKAPEMNARSRPKLEKKWGDQAWPALQLLQKHLHDRRFVGPLSLAEPGFLSFRTDPTPRVRVLASVSRCGASEAGAGLFDLVFTVWSASIFDSTSPTDSWHPVRSGNDKWLHGYVPCLTASLAHQKWAIAESARNPAWEMTVAGCESCVVDMDLLVMPTLRSIHSDADLHKLLTCALNYRRPPWVLSDGPGFRDLPALANALATRAPAGPRH